MQGLGSAGFVIAVLLVGIVAGYAAPRLAGSLKLGERISAFTSAGKTQRRGKSRSTARSGRSRKRTANRKKRARK